MQPKNFLKINVANTTISTFNQNHPNHSTVFVALGNTVTYLVSKQHLEAPTVALVAELLSKTEVQ
jgi:hypothetical protein